MRKIKYLFLLLYLVFFPYRVSASSYDVTNYYMDITIDENNIYNISEYYNIMFDKKANFTRNISLRPKVYLTNNEFITYVTQVDKLDVSEEFSVTQNKNDYEVKTLEKYEDLGKSISVTYSYNMGQDLDEKRDVVFISILDGSFTPVTNEVSFSIILPTPTEKENVSFYIDGVKVKDEESIVYYVTDNHIEGTITREFKKGEVISIQVSLPNGTFKNTISNEKKVSNENKAIYLLLLIPFITFVISFLINKKYKKEKTHPVEDVYQITNNFDSAEVAYLLKGSINSRDIVSIIFKLANDGYVSFKNYESEDNIIFKIKKQKEYDKDNAVQKIVFDGLFQNKEEVGIEDIEGTFYQYYIDAKRTLENVKNDKKLFYKNIDKIKKAIIGISYVGVVLLQLTPLYNLLNSYVFATIISVVISVLFVLLLKIKNKIIKYILLVISLCIIVVEIYALLDLKTNLIIYIAGIILTALTLVIELLIPTRTIYGNQIKYEIDLFRLGLLSMSDDKFKEKVSNNSNYFFEMIPYMIIFDLNGWWFDRFIDQMETKIPWYESSELYTKENIKEFIEEIIHQFSIAIQVNKTSTDELLNQAPNKLL